jgi:hypothetical protein
MATVSDILAAAEPAAAAGGSPPVVVDSPSRARARARDARARARIPVTHSVRKTVLSDLSESWVWRDAPPSLRQIVDGRIPAAERVPNGSGPLRAVWVVWNVGVAVPTTAALYVLAWVLQHPARALLAAAVAGPILTMWITN